MDKVYEIKWQKELYHNNYNKYKWVNVTNLRFQNQI